MLGYIACAVIWVIIVSMWLIPVIRKRIVYEIYEGFGLGGFFSLLALNLGDSWTHYDILALKIIGFILYLPAIFFIAISFLNLRQKGKPEDAWEHTTVLVSSGVYGIVRHPMYFGTAVWTLGAMLVFPSIPSALLGAACLICYFIACKKEDDYNLEKFGPAYKEHMQKVPMINVFRGIFRK